MHSAIKLAARFRLGGLTSSAEAAKAAMAAVALRHGALTAEIAQLDTSLETLHTPPRPASWPGGCPGGWGISSAGAWMWRGRQAFTRGGDPADFWRR